MWASCRGEVARKEVIQPHLPIRLPCYDFTPVIDHTVVGVLLAVRLPASGAANSHGVTGGVYKARERIHRDIADSRLLAIPTSWSRVADSNLDYEKFFGISSPLRVATALSDAPHFRGLTGGVYKAQEHIHRGVADPRLLAIPTSRRRVAASDLNWGVICAISSNSRFRFALCTPL